MEAISWMHYCEDPRSRRYVLCDISDLKEVSTWRYNAPYESLYCFNTVQLANLIYFTGGGAPASEASQELFYQITMQVAIMPSMETVADRLANMKIARANHGMEGIGNSLYVLGGSNSSGYLDLCEEYDIANNSWRNIARLGERKKWISTCVFNSRYLYCFGGCINDKGEPSKLIECLDITNLLAESWESIELTAGKELIKGSFFIGAMNISDSYILLFGGILKAEDDLCVAFDPVKRTFERQKGILKRDSFYRTRYGASGKNYVIVGCRDGDLHIYDKETRKWSLMVKKIWNPKYEIAIKADTF